MDAERRLGEPRPAVRRLRDISHLYLSSSRTSPRLAAPPQPAPRRQVRIGLAGPGSAAARSAVGANLAVQLARLGRRTLVIDLDPALPGIGFCLGLQPEDALAHVAGGAGARLARGILGLQVLCGVAANPAWESQAIAWQTEVGRCDCVLVQVGPQAEPESVAALGRLLPALVAGSTLGRAAASSPMIGAWLATAQRPAAPAPEPGPRGSCIDLALWIVPAAHAGEPPPAALGEVLETVPRRVVYGTESPGSEAAPAWAHLPVHRALDWLPISAVDPEAPASRLYEGFAQAVLAAAARPGGAPHA